MTTDNYSTNPGDAESSRTELLFDQNQRLISYGAIVGSVMLALQHVAIGAHFHGWPQMVVTVLSLLGWGVFAFGMYRSVRLKQTPEGKSFAEGIAHDERLLSIRSKSFASGFFAMLAMQVVLIVLAVVFGPEYPDWLSVVVAAPATIAAGVTGSVLRFQTLSSDD